MGEDPDHVANRRLAELSRRLDEARGRRETVAASQKEASGRGQALGAGFRLASELIAAVLVGLLLGIGLDAWVGTSPFGLLGGLFLGFAAGLRNAVAAMGRTAPKEDENGHSAVEGKE